MDTQNQKMLTLPFDIMELQDLKESNEKIYVDMSITNFPKELNNVNTTFVYLRNIGFTNLCLDFSKCSYKTKSEYLIEYIKTKFEVKQNEFSGTLLKILVTMYGDIELEDEINSFMNEEEIHEFIEENRTVLETILNFLISLPLYQIMRLELEEGTVLDKNGIKENDEAIMGENLYTFLEYSQDIIGSVFMLNTKQLEPKIYTKYFTKDNERLLYILKDSITNAILYCIANKDTDLIDNINKANNLIVKGDENESK